VAAIALVAVACAAMCGCTNSVPEVSASPTRYFEDLIARATVAGAGEQQMTALRAAADAGGVTYAQVDARMADFFECARDAGLRPERAEDRPIAPNVSAPDYYVEFGGLPMEQGNDLTQACLTKTMDFAMEALHQQPSSIEAQEADTLAHLDEIAACTAAHGHPLTADATLDEIYAAQHEVFAEANVECYVYSG